MLKCAASNKAEALKEIEKILGKKLSKATEGEKKKAFRKMHIKYHPDKNRGNEAYAEKAFKFVEDIRAGRGDSEEYARKAGKAHSDHSRDKWTNSDYKKYEQNTGQHIAANIGIGQGVLFNAVQGGVNLAAAKGVFGGENAQKAYSNEYYGKGGLIGQGVGAAAGLADTMYQINKKGLKGSTSLRRKVYTNNALGAANVGGIIGGLGGSIYGLHRHNSDKKSGNLKYRRNGSKIKRRS